MPNPQDRPDSYESMPEMPFTKAKKEPKKRGRKPKTKETPSSKEHPKKETTEPSLPKFSQTEGEEQLEFQDAFRDLETETLPSNNEPLVEAIDHYNRLRRDHPTALAARHEFDPETAQFETVQQAIMDLEEEIDRPIREAYYGQMWKGLVFFGTKLVERTSFKEYLEPEPTEDNPTPKKISKVFMEPDVVRDARPVMRELAYMFPFLDTLRNMDDPRVKLVWTCALTGFAVYKYNSDANVRREVDMWEQMGQSGSGGRMNLSNQ